jgi:hypothetical protein
MVAEYLKDGEKEYLVEIEIAGKIFQFEMFANNVEEVEKAIIANTSIIAREDLDENAIS